MENNIVDTLATRFGQSATVKNVYGEPLNSHNKTIIPVAQVIMGMGGGYGRKKGKDELSLKTTNEPLDGEGAGGGGGMIAMPKGVYEVTDKRTRFIPANATRQMLAIGTIAFLFGRWAGRRNRKKELYKALKKA